MLINLKLKTFLLTASLFCYGFLSVSAQMLTNDELFKQPVYTSLKKALESPEQVYRLKLKGRLKSDSIPDEIFKFVNLQELTLNGNRLYKINSRISELQYLVYLDLSRNKLVDLPEEICDLQFLRALIINRNLIYKLPENIGKLKNLMLIDAWGNQFYELPQSISLLKDNLKMLDILQIPIKEEEYLEMKKMLPNTEILYSIVCPCVIDR
ncbi:MAG: hypothetical protein CVU04_03910 [Bacteroidetes bacterium HGW-Bacteroidetes-20]|nr:MAG: hypothetical protein CVU04_03910 [Bacteroidetes bacterium HGW-Bacteroidetes-20]